MRTDEIRGEIEKLRDVEKNAFRRRHAQFEFYNYLDRVLRFYWGCQDSAKRRTARKMIASKYNLKGRRRKRLLHVIIEATSQQLAQTRIAGCRRSVSRRSTAQRVEKAISAGKFDELSATRMPGRERHRRPQGLGRTPAHLAFDALPDDDNQRQRNSFDDAWDRGERS